MMGPRVVNFHGIGQAERELEPGEGHFWIGVDRFCDLLDRIAAHPDRALFSITFDDGNISDLTVAAPQLLRRGLGAEVFVVTGRIGQAGSLGAGDIRQLLRLGIRIGSHGVAHLDWTSLPAGQLHDELNDSRSRLEYICGSPVRSAAIPFGRYNRVVLQALRKAGYKTAYSSDGAGMDEYDFLRPRTSIRRNTSDSAFDMILSGSLPLMRRLSRTATMALKKWV